MTHDLTALADRLAAFQRILESARRRDDQTIRVWSDDLASVSGAVTALRSLAAQDQKPVAWRVRCTDKSRGSTGHYYTEQLPFEPGENLRQRSEPVPLHLSPPPAAGWDARKALEAIEPYLDAIVCYASSINEHHGNQVAKMVREALRHNAPPDSGAGESDDSWDEATGYAERLAVSLWEKHYKTDADQWMPLSGDLIGILTQIDNMTTGLARVPDHASAELSKFANDLAAKQEPLGVQISAEDLEGMYIRSEPSANASTELQNDLGDMLRALGMSDAAQPKSPHEVFQSAIAEMKRQRANASAEARMREALEKTNQLLIDVMHDQEADIRDRASQQFDKNIDALSKPAPVAANASAEARLRGALESCKVEHLKFEEWATGEKYEMHEHPLHYLFLNEKTDAARQGWKAALRYVQSVLSAHPHASDCDKQGATKSETIALSDLPTGGSHPGIGFGHKTFVRHLVDDPNSASGKSLQDVEVVPSDRTADDLPAIRSANDWDKQGER